MSKPEYRIQPATADQAHTLAGMISAMAWETEHLRLNPVNLLAGVKAVFTQPARGTYWLVSLPSPQNQAQFEPVGCTLITEEWSDWNNAPYWWIQSLYIRPEFRGQGLFRQLLAHLEAVGKQAGACEIRLYVERENERAINTYLRSGFEGERYLCMTRVLTPTPVLN